MTLLSVSYLLHQGGVAGFLLGPGIVVSAAKTAGWGSAMKAHPTASVFGTMSSGAGYSQDTMAPTGRMRQGGAGGLYTQPSHCGMYESTS